MMDGAFVPVDPCNPGTPQRPIAPDPQPPAPLFFANPQQKFRREEWDPSFSSFLVLADFLALDWRAEIVLGPPPGEADTLQEIAQMLQMRDNERPHLDAEIQAQADDPHGYWLDLLGFGRNTHPRTYEITTAAMLVARATHVWFKNVFERSRPSRLCPSLHPNVTIPGTPAYPSGHATVAMTIASSLRAIVPAAGPAVEQLARRIGRNREVAGAHYPSDTAAGQILANQAFGLLSSRVPRFQAWVDEAKQEWSV